MSSSDFIDLGYLLAAILFILGLKGLARPRTAVRGNKLGAAGMLVAVLVTLADQAILSYQVLAVALVIGTAIGAVLALKVKMTSMPELVALFNGFGGGASVLVVAASFIAAVELGADDTELAIAAAATAFIGAMTLTGSMVAFGKLQGSLSWSGFAGLPLLRGAFLLATLPLSVLMVTQPENQRWLWALVIVGFAVGVLGTVAIGGADMPVVIALLNAMSGVAASTTGFVLDNSLLIIAGSLVGASGLVLTQIMCKAMNRTLFEVLFTAAPTGTSSSGDDDYGDNVSVTSGEEVAMLLEIAERVVIVPGYGMAVAQAQHAVRDLMTALEAAGVEVMFGIHPVAGRMPGHMNVLLAEAEIDYEHLLDMDQVNPTFARTDVTIVIGANDVVNPAARTDPDSPIAGMPILNVDESRTVVVIKRSLSPGFAGVANPLFVADNTLLYFADARDAVLEITTAMVSV